MYKPTIEDNRKGQFNYVRNNWYAACQPHFRSTGFQYKKEAQQVVSTAEFCPECQAAN